MNALEMKLIALKFALARRQVGLPNDQRFQTHSGATDVQSITAQLSQGVTINDRDLTVNNTVIEDNCEHQANTEPTIETTTTPAPITETPPPIPIPLEPVVVASVEPQIVQTQPQPTTTPAALSFGGRIWEYFRDSGNGPPKS